MSVLGATPAERACCGGDGDGRQEGVGPLAGVRLSLTGFDQEEREEVADLVHRLGGTFCAQLERGVCTHLLVSPDAPDNTPKLVAARKWGAVALLPATWLRACALAGARVPEAGYLLEPVAPPPPPAADSGHHRQQHRREASTKRSHRAENTLQQAAGGGATQWSQEQLLLEGAAAAWCEPPAWDALSLSGTCVAFDVGFADHTDAARAWCVRCPVGGLCFEPFGAWGLTAACLCVF